MNRRIYFWFVVGITGILTLQGCDFLYRLLDKEGAEEKALVGEVVPFEKNLTVEEIQTLLKLYGYNPGKIDGVMGLKTRNAIEEFQHDNGLKETRFVDRATWAKLTVFEDNGMIVDGKFNIRLIQTALQRSGFDPGKADGKFGPRTKRAIKDFQKAFGLKVDGEIGYQTLSKLSEYIPQQTP